VQMHLVCMCATICSGHLQPPSAATIYLQLPSAAAICSVT
jgi:hypothetical protein